MRLRLSKKADADLDEIWLYLARETRSEDVATRAIGQISKSFDILLHFPHTGRSQGTAKHPDMRCLPCGDYLIFYRISKGILHVVRVVHGKRDIAQLGV
jgi:toxin ParE1/3/4